MVSWFNSDGSLTGQTAQIPYVLHGVKKPLPARVKDQKRTFILLRLEIEDLSNEILQTMRHEPMSLQPQAGFGSAQEEVDRIYDYMQNQIKCNDLHYVGTTDNSGTYQDGAYAVCLDVCRLLNFIDDNSYQGKHVAWKG